MYYKKYGNEPPVIKTGCVYEESYLHEGNLFLKYSKDNIPSEKLMEVSSEEYKANKPISSVPETIKESTETEQLMQAMTDAELRDMVTQQNQELLAQQMTDIEVALLGGDK
ncbi:hypothetical protein [Anaerotignum sp.]|uniref:hypothetical protein n=1 Tax=Anaerotignum sp. TaxID=2039241 RepID=UPI0028A14489|nr:hypothetical protein [Anaerotignum sp.]